jgi:hypothetical protein
MQWGEVLLLLGTVSVGAALSTGAVGGSDGLSILGYEPALGGPLDPFDAAYLHHKYAADGNATTGCDSSACGGGHSYHADEGFGVGLHGDAWFDIARCAPPGNGMVQHCEQPDLSFLIGGDAPFNGLFCPFNPANMLHKYAMAFVDGDSDIGDEPPDLVSTFLFLGIESDTADAYSAADDAGLMCFGAGDYPLDSGLCDDSESGPVIVLSGDTPSNSLGDIGPTARNSSAFSCTGDIEASLSTVHDGSSYSSSASWLMMQVSGKDTCRYFDVSTLAPLALYDFHEGLCGLPPAFPAAPDDDDDDPTDQGPHSAEYLAPCLLAILTAFGALRCIDPRLFSRRLAKVSWSDVSFCANLPAMVAYVGYYAALMPRIFVDASVPSWPEHVIVVGLLAVLAATTLFLRHFALAPSKAAKSEWARCYLGVAAGFAVVVSLVAPLAMASSIGGGAAGEEGFEPLLTSRKPSPSCAPRAAAAER